MSSQRTQIYCETSYVKALLSLQYACFSRQALAQSVCVQLANIFLYDLSKMSVSVGFHGFQFLMLTINMSFLLGKEQPQDCKNNPDCLNVLIFHTGAHHSFGYLSQLPVCSRIKYDFTLSNGRSLLQHSVCVQQLFHRQGGNCSEERIK